LSPNLRASLCMMLAMAGFSFNDATIKTLDGALPSGQILAIRGLFAVLFFLPLLLRQRLFGRLSEALLPIVLFRALMELGGTLAFLAALVHLPFASISAILQSLPLAVTLGAALVFREPVGWRRWLAIVIGFGGVLLVVRPGAESFQAVSLLVVLAVCFAAARDLSTRAMPETLPSLLVSASTVLLGAVGGAALVLVQGNWIPMELAQLRTLAMAAAFMLIAQLFIVLAMRSGEVAFVVPFRYTNLLWAIALGLLLFDEVPDAWTLSGAAVIVITGLYTLFRETRRRAGRPDPAVAARL